MSSQILQVGDAPQGSTEAPFALNPNTGQLFDLRAQRFHSLAEAVKDKPEQANWLNFLAELSAAQHAVLNSVAQCELPPPSTRELAHTHLLPPLSTASMPRDPAWQNTLKRLIEHLQKSGAGAACAPDSPLYATLQQLKTSHSATLETLASKVINHQLTEASDRAASLFIGAALQVYWSVLAAQIDSKTLQRLDNKGLCPCCGSLPVASVVRVGGAQGELEGLRYLHCSLCNTEWNLVRVTCASCDDNAGIAYHSLQGLHPAVRAETCDTCRAYLKIIYLEKDPQADPVADDLATLALDLLIDEAGYERAGPNLFLLAGA